MVPHQPTYNYNLTRYQLGDIQGERKKKSMDGLVQKTPFHSSYCIEDNISQHY